MVYGCPLSRGMGESKPNCSSQLLNYCTFCTCQLNEALYCVCQLQKGTISYLHTFILCFSPFFLDSLIQCLVFWEPHPNRNINYQRKIPPLSNISVGKHVNPNFKVCTAFFLIWIHFFYTDMARKRCI